MSKFLIVCMGSVQKFNCDFQYLLFKDFVGEICYSFEFKMFIFEYVNKCVMLIGGGEIVSDVVEEWYDYVLCLIWCILCGMYFFWKFVKIFFYCYFQVLDKVFFRVMKFIVFFMRSKLGQKN